MSLAIFSSCSSATFEAVVSCSSLTYFDSENCMFLKAVRSESTSRLFTSGSSTPKCPLATSLAAFTKRPSGLMFFQIIWWHSR